MNITPTFVIAEMACSHEGDINLAKLIIDGAFKSEADAVQLQIWSLENMMSPQRKEYELLQRLEFSPAEWSELVSYCRVKYPEMLVYVCAYEHSTIEFINSLGIDGFKLNSSDLSNPLVLEKVANIGKPINLSVGASSIAEIQYAVDIIQGLSQAKITLMYGHQSFPTKPENVHMSYLTKLANLFELPLGYQDHCDEDEESAFWLPAASMGMGVSVLEKHITHDRSLKGIDHESALNLDEFVKFVEMVRCIDQAKGISSPRKFTDEEIKYREFQKKSIVVTSDLKSGDTLTRNNIAFMRAEKLGLAPNKIDRIIGKRINKNLLAFEVVLEGDVL
jgi:N,N'-diacetyllegionaminate synthase